MTYKLFGWIGAILFALCGFPQAYTTIKNKNAHGISKWFLIMWFLAEIFTIIYVIPLGEIPLLLNYIVNLGIVIVIGYYKIFPET